MLTDAERREHEWVMEAIKRRMPFGRHKGAALSKVPTDYLRWVLSLKNLHPATRRRVREELEWRSQEAA